MGIIGLGTSGPIIALSVMPILTLIFWRNLGGAFITALFAVRLREWKSPSQRRGIKLSALAGVVLSAHFIGFFIAMRYTTVAAGTALAAMQPFFAAFFLHRLGGVIPRRAWLGIVLAFLGVLVITGVDFFLLSPSALLGDLSALVGAAVGAWYLLIGSKAQKLISTSTYTSVCYFFCAITCLPLIFITKAPLTNFATKQWLYVLALIGGAQILGHTMFNLALKRVSPAVVSLVIFFEVPLSAFLAYWWIGQVPPIGIFPGLVLLLIGCTLFVLPHNPKKITVSSPRD